MELVTPQRGAKMDLIRLANQNAAEEVARATTGRNVRTSCWSAGQDAGHGGAPPADGVLPTSPTLDASDIVASMVVYVDGRPLKRDYRRFKLKDMEGPDDYAPWSRC